MSPNRLYAKLVASQRQACQAKWRQLDSSTWLLYNNYEITKQTFSNIENSKLLSEAGTTRLESPNETEEAFMQIEVLADAETVAARAAAIIAGHARGTFDARGRLSFQSASRRLSQHAQARAGLGAGRSIFVPAVRAAD